MLILFTAINAADTLEGIYFKNSIDQTQQEVEIQIKIIECEVKEFLEVGNFSILTKIGYSGAYLNQNSDIVVASEETERELRVRLTKSAIETAAKKASQMDHIKKYGTEPTDEEKENFINYIKANYEEEKCIEIGSELGTFLKPKIVKGKNNSQSNLFKSINGTEVLIIDRNGNSSVDVLENRSGEFFTRREFSAGSLVIQNWEAVGIIDSDRRKLVNKEKIQEMDPQNKIENTEKEQNRLMKEALIEASGAREGESIVLARVSQGLFDTNPQIKEEIIKKFKKEDYLPLFGVIFLLLIGLGALLVRKRKKK